MSQPQQNKTFKKDYNSRDKQIKPQELDANSSFYSKKRQLGTQHTEKTYQQRHPSFTKPRSQLSPPQLNRKSLPLKKKPKSKLSPDVQDYYKRIRQSLDQEVVDDAMERELFLENVFEQLKSDLIKVSVDSFTSNTIERLMAVAPADHIVEYLRTFKNNLQKLCADKIATFVIQSCLYRASFFLSDDNPHDALEKQLGFFAGTLINQADELMKVNCSFYVYRTTIEVLAGVRVKENQPRKGVTIIVEKPMKEHNRYAEFESHLDSLFRLMVNTSNLSELIDTVTHPTKTATLNVVLEVMKRKKPTIFKVISQDIISSGYLYMPEDLSQAKAFTDKTASHFTCHLFKLLDDETIIPFLEKNVAPQVTDLIKDGTGNYALQACFTDTISIEKFQCLLDMFEKHMPLIVESGRVGILLHMVQAAVKHPFKQGFVLKLLSKAYRVKPEMLFSAISNLDSGEPISYLSSSILQTLVKFKETNIVLEGLMDMEASLLANIAKSNYGSYLLTAFLFSTKIVRQNKIATIEKMQDYYDELAVSKFGSRIMESFWDIATVPVRYAIADKLSRSISQLIKDYQHGRIVANKLRLNEYKHNKPEWERWLMTQPKATHRRYEKGVPKEHEGNLTSFQDKLEKVAGDAVDHNQTSLNRRTNETSIDESRTKKRRLDATI